MGESLPHIVGREQHGQSARLTKHVGALACVIAPNFAIAVNDGESPILLQETLDIEVDEITRRANNEARCGAEAAAYHSADHYAQSCFARHQRDYQELFDYRDIR